MSRASVAIWLKPQHWLSADLGSIDLASRRLLFQTFYRLGFVPWDGHPLPKSLQDLVEGENALAAGTALDIGCGTGDNSIYLAKHGWQVTGVDFVAKAVDKARAKVGQQTRHQVRPGRRDAPDFRRCRGEL